MISQCEPGSKNYWRIALELFVPIFSVGTRTAVVVKAMAFFGFGELGQFCEVLFKLSKESPRLVASSVVTIEHVRVSHVGRIVTEKRISRNNVLKSRVVGQIALASPCGAVGSNREASDSGRQQHRMAQCGRTRPMTTTNRNLY